MNVLIYKNYNSFYSYTQGVYRVCETKRKMLKKFETVSIVAVPTCVRIAMQSSSHGVLRCTILPAVRTAAHHSFALQCTIRESASNVPVCDFDLCKKIESVSANHCSSPCLSCAQM